MSRCPGGPWGQPGQPGHSPGAPHEPRNPTGVASSGMSSGMNKSSKARSDQRPKIAKCGRRSRSDPIATDGPWTPTRKRSGPLASLSLTTRVHLLRSVLPEKRSQQRELSKPRRHTSNPIAGAGR